MILQRQHSAESVVDRNRSYSAVTWWIVAALLGLILGLTAGWLLFNRTPAEGSADVRFARDMAVHHNQAVEMAMLLRDRTKDDELRTLTLDIMLTQQAQIGQMQGWLASWGYSLGGGSTMGAHGEAMGMAPQPKVNALATLPLHEAEVSFLQLMIRHHQGAVAMAEETLREARRPEVRALAEAIVASQQSEITYMQELLAERGVTDPAAEPAPEHGGHE